MKKKQQHVYPPFPSFAWVITTQANPPAPAYAYGYVQSAHAHNGPHPHPRHPSTHRAHHKAHRHPKRPSSSPTRVRAAAHDEKLMVCVIDAPRCGGRKLSSRLCSFFFSFRKRWIIDTTTRRSGRTCPGMRVTHCVGAARSSLSVNNITTITNGITKCNTRCL